MLPLTRSRNRARFFGIPFSPSELFAAGEQGAWYDPSDLTTLFQDSAGATPVTAVEQFVGRMNDKSGRGNHATSTGTKRPKLAARYNLLTYTEQFDNAAWGKSNVTVTANAAIAPDGTTTADELVNTAVTNVHDIEQGTITPTVGTLYRITWRVKKSTNRYVALGWWRTTGSAAGAGFDLDTGTVTGTGAIGADYSATNATIAALGNGWYEIGVTVTGSALLQVAALFHRATAYTGGASTFLGESYAGTTADKTFIWGADLRPTSQATGLIGPTYQRVVDAATYDTAGYLPYLSFDGIDDSMSTGSIDFTATDKMTVWAGVRKIGAITAFPVELSTIANSTNGAFAIGSDSSGIEYFFDSRGTALQQVFADSAAYTSPVTNVLQMSNNISGPSVSVRINAVSVGSNSGSQGTGNFGNYPLFIGARNNASFFFNGWLTSLIVRGAQSTDSQINATESWVAGKTGVQLTTQSTISVQNSGGTAYSVPLTVLNSSGNSYTVTNTVLSSNGTSYTV